MNIELIKRSVYGRDVYYPVSKAAVAIAAIAGTTTLTERVLKIAVAGFDAKVSFLPEPAPTFEETT